MGQKTYFAVVGIIFALVALAHAVRVVHGVASHNWGLVGAEVSELGRPRGRWRPRSFGV